MIHCPKCGREIPSAPHCLLCGAKTAPEVKPVSQGIRAPEEVHEKFDHFAEQARYGKGEAFTKLVDFADKDILKLANHATHGDVEAAIEIARRLVNQVVNGGPLAKYASILLNEEAAPNKAAELLIERLKKQKKEA